MTHLNRYIRSFGIALALLVTIVSGSQSAFAQSSRTWLPAYDNSQKVYIDPSLTDFSLTPGFAGEVQQLASKHNLNVVVIATARGADITASDRKRWAPEYLHTTAWQHLERYPGFSEARSVVILFVKDGTTISTGVRVGSAMHAVGLTRDVLNRTDGPVVPVLRANMPGEPEAAFIGIVKNINGYLDAKTAVQAPSTSTPSGVSNDEGGGGGIPAGVLIVLGLGIAVVIFMLLSRSGGSSSGSSSRHTSSTRSSSSRPTTTTGDGRSDGSNRATDIATGVVIGGVLGAELTRRGQQPAPKEKKKDSGSSDGGGTTTGGDTGGTTGGSGCGSAGCSGGSSCGGGGCGGS